MADVGQQSNPWEYRHATEDEIAEARARLSEMTARAEQIAHASGCAIHPRVAALRVKAKETGPLTDQKAKQPEPVVDPAEYIERFAATIGCHRHVPHMRACRYEGGKPCTCREFRDLMYGR